MLGNELTNRQLRKEHYSYLQHSNFNNSLISIRERRPHNIKEMSCLSSINLAKNALRLSPVYFLTFSIFLFVLGDCRKEDGTECQNGACLDNQCHCNDGYGGCSCEVPGMLKIALLFQYPVAKCLGMFYLRFNINKFGRI